MWHVVTAKGTHAPYNHSVSKDDCKPPDTVSRRNKNRWCDGHTIHKGKGVKIESNGVN